MIQVNLVRATVAAVAGVLGVGACSTPFPDELFSPDPLAPPPEVLSIYYTPTRSFCVATAGDFWRFQGSVCNEWTGDFNRRGFARGLAIREAAALPNPTAHLAEKLAAELRAHPAFANTQILVAPFDPAKGEPAWYLLVFPKTWHLWPGVVTQWNLHLSYNAVLAVGRAGTDFLPWRTDCGQPRTHAARLARWTTDGGRLLHEELDALLDRCARALGEKVINRSPGWPTI
jgi:hypothetical protein